MFAENVFCFRFTSRLYFIIIIAVQVILVIVMTIIKVQLASFQFSWLYKQQASGRSGYIINVTALCVDATLRTNTDRGFGRNSD